MAMPIGSRRMAMVAKIREHLFLKVGADYRERVR